MKYVDCACNTPSRLIPPQDVPIATKYCSATYERSDPARFVNDRSMFRAFYSTHARLQYDRPTVLTEGCAQSGAEPLAVEARISQEPHAGRA